MKRYMRAPIRKVMRLGILLNFICTLIQLARTMSCDVFGVTTEKRFHAAYNAIDVVRCNVDGVICERDEELVGDLNVPPMRVAYGESYQTPFKLKMLNQAVAGLNLILEPLSSDED